MHKKRAAEKICGRPMQNRAFLSLGELVGAVGVPDDVAREGEEGDDVGDDHELVEQVAQLPDKVVGHGGAEVDEDERKAGVDAAALFAEEVDHVDLAEEVPAEDRGEGKEEETHRDEHIARGLAEDRAEGALGEVRFVEDVLRICR